MATNSPGYNKRWHSANPEKKRAYELKYKFGLSLTDYEALLQKQDGKCAGCLSVTPGPKRTVFCVDHCHNTGAVRGLLCVSCNLILGKAHDDVSTLERLIGLLNGSQKKTADSNA
jgi:hypothetical protein